MGIVDVVDSHSPYDRGVPNTAIPDSKSSVRLGVP